MPLCVLRLRPPAAPIYSKRYPLCIHVSRKSVQAQGSIAIPYRLDLQATSVPIPRPVFYYNMDAPAFATSVALGVRPSNGRSVCATRSPSTQHVTRAVLGSSFKTSTEQDTKTLTVKVMQGNRCTVINVDRDTDLRRAMLDNKIDLYTLGGKFRNCGGAGQCGTCLIAVEDGVYGTNGRTPREEFLLEGKPANWRLACRTLITSDVTIRTKPKE